VRVPHDTHLTNLVRGVLLNPTAASDGNAETAEVMTEAEIKQRERDNIAAALAPSNARIYGPGGAAELLGMRLTAIGARLKKLRLKSNE
jgi:transcriptional regulator with GAF, ATPase, and Fis domain